MGCCLVYETTEWRTLGTAIRARVRYTEHTADGHKYICRLYMRLRGIQYVHRTAYIERNYDGNNCTATRHARRITLSAQNKIGRRD